MTAETQAKVFDPFFTTKLAGHGLGLAVVQGIVGGLGGAVRVVSAPGKGTTFQILLPCAENPTQAKISIDSQAATETPKAAAATVLVVEDEDVLRRALLKTLQTMGLTVLEAGDGSTALDLLRTCEETIHVLLLDVTLPGTSSREVFDEARRLRPYMKMVVTSAYRAERAAASLAGTFDRCIRKPYRLVHLAELIHEVLSSAHSHRAGGTAGKR